MADANTWKQVSEIARKSQPCLLVVSATSGTTDSLIDAAELARQGNKEDALSIANSVKTRHDEVVRQFARDNNADESVLEPAFNQIEELTGLLTQYLNGIYTLEELTDKTLDGVTSIGERLSSALLDKCMKANGFNSEHVDARDMIKTDNHHGEAIPDREKISSAAERLNKDATKDRIYVMGGFFGSSPEGKITTLGRGGSDFSASLMAEALQAQVLEVWTDVSGMYTCDPRLVPEATSIPEISFHEAAELAYFGARILHPATIQPAVESNIPVKVKNTFAPDHPGTVITSEVDKTKNIKAIAFKRDITLITISSSRMLMAYGFLARVFSVFEHLELPVDLVTTSEVSVTMSIDESENLDELCEVLSAYGEVSVDPHQALVCLVGNNFLKSRGIANRAFSALADIPVRMISQGSSDMNLSLVIANDLVEKGVRELHAEFFPKR